MCMCMSPDMSCHFTLQVNTYILLHKNTRIYTVICYLNSVSSHFPTVLIISIRDHHTAGLLCVYIGPQIPGISSEIQIHEQKVREGGTQ